MTKEEYIKQLEAQFGDETLIPETKEPAPEAEPSQEAVVEEPAEEPAPATEASGDEATAPEGTEENAEVGEGEGDEEPVNPDNGKKFSNKKIKRTIWENKHLAKEVAELKKQLEEMRAAAAPKPEKQELVAPSRSQYNSDEEYTNAAFAYNLKLLAEKNRAHTEEQMEAARVMEEKQRIFQEKIRDNIPESKIDEFNKFMSENYQNLQESVVMDAQNNIMSMSTAPLIMWKLAQSPDLISSVNRMNPVERIMFCTELAKQMKAELNNTQPVVKTKAPVLGKLGTGKSGGHTSVDEMTDDEMYRYMSKRLSGQQ